ncbi:TatD family hydrolase [Echinimonas agarilytica]|uniref:YchF/TatD family DNA exonuclease n=1 Tax=Echinimonas agarilytica TaxID=1215918 RepID=A0AA42B7P7_9GAMM|nr:YchF/TatD family DNA exonuclease [Echinimonas agarilytica]MCM2679899.1 YchF/TatD family DNA exonuclease [Echinimonas agarilytica]
MLVDSHCHLNRLKLNEGETLDDAVNYARSRDIEHMLCVSVSLEEFPSMRDAVAKFPDVSVSCGVHPLDLETPYDLDTLRHLSTSDDVVAIGETGLDYYYSKDTIGVQQASFRNHIRVARELNKPLIIHTRDAREDTIAILKEEKGHESGGVMHCFTESLEMAQASMELGFMISFSGIVTFKNAEELRQVALAVPLEQMLVETDSPYLAPVPYRGKSNQPGYVREVAEYLAVLKGVTYEELARITTENFYRLFPLTKRT